MDSIVFVHFIKFAVNTVQVFIKTVLYSSGKY